MAERNTPHIWTMRIAYVALALVIIFFHLLPLDTQPRRWAPPDLLLAFTYAWALRRPDYVPLLLMAGVMLMADLMFQRPPGLFALLVVLGGEYLKYRTQGLSDASFLGEWAAVCIVVVGVTLLNRLILGLVLVPPPALTPSLIHMILTVMIYPLIVLVSQFLLGVRRPAPNDAGTLGSRA